MADPHSPLIKTPKQLFVVVAAAFVVPVIVIGLLAALVTSGKKGENTDPARVVERIRPVGTVVIAGPRVALSAEEVYEQVCKTCHGAGLAGAPRLGDKAAWAKIVAQGEKTVVAHAINGFKAMPAKGGNPELTDAEVHAAVVHIVNASGGNWKMPPPAPAPAATAAKPQPPAAAAAPAAPAIAAVPMPPAAAAPAAQADGKSVYDSACAACHTTGVAGSPKIGDKAAWAPRLAAGKDALYASAIKGKGAMPPKGGQTQLSDAQVRAAVDFILASVK